jgi:putative membrane protein
MYYNYPMMDGQDRGWGLFMMVFWVLVLAIASLVIVRLLKSHELGAHHRADPLSIVKERYAKGEIKKEEFEQLKKDLK